jgi:hypothetical protein
MRSAVVRQMKKPMEKRMTRPILDPMDMLRRSMTGIGRMKIAMSVRRLRAALDQLEGASAHRLGTIPAGVENFGLTDAMQS